MGNVHAAGGGDVPAPQIIPAPPMPGDQPASATGQPQAPAPKEPLLKDKPGYYEDLHKNCKDIFPVPFEGAKLTMNKGLSYNFQVSHTMTMSNVMPSGYRFGCTYVGTKQYGPAEAYPVLLGDIDLNGNLNAQIVHKWTENIRQKFVAQIQNNKWVATQLSTEYKGSDWTSNITIGNPDLLKGSCLFMCHYLQQVTPSLSLGAELLYQRGPQLPGYHVAMLTFSGRYATEDWIFAGSVSPGMGGLHASYYHRLGQLGQQFGVEVETSLQMQESTATLGYQLELPVANCTVKGQIDTNWCIGAILEKKLMPIPATLALSAFCNQTKGSYRFGIGFMVG